MTGTGNVPTEPRRRAALRAALTEGHEQHPEAIDLDERVSVDAVTSSVTSDVSAEFTIQQADAVIAVANALHYAGALSTLLPDADQCRAFRSGIKELKLARISAVRMAARRG